MKKITKILVPLDGSSNSKRALCDALFLAKLANASITGIYVINSEPEIDSFLDILKPLSSLEKKGFVGKQFADADVIMGESNMECQKNKISFEGIVAQGDPGFKIVQYAERNEFDIIIVGMTGKGHSDEIILGSVSYFVVHKAKSPVLVVK